jgi:CHAT domain-containing protein/tetratricopeptide (TPR) repeat protein
MAALNKYEEALSYWATVANRSEEAKAFKNIGDVYSRLAQNEKALDYYNQALPLSQQVQDRQLEIDLLNDIGYIENDLNKPDKTREYCHRALLLSQEIGYGRGEAQALSNIGLTYYNSGDMQKALEIFQQSLARWKTTTDHRGEAQALINTGYAYGDLGEIKNALPYFSQALTLSQTTKDLRGQILALAASGLIYTWQGEMQAAYNAYKEALEISKLIGDRYGEAVSLNGIGYLYDDLGEKPKALDFYTQAARRFRDIGNLTYEAFTMGYAGNIYSLLGDEQKSLECYYRELEICRSLPNHRMEAYALREIGAAHASFGNSDEAFNHYNSSLLLSKEVYDRRGEAYTLNNIGYLYDKLAEKQKGLYYYNQALPLMQTVQDRAGEILTLYNIARVMRDLGQLAEAGDKIKTVIDIIETLRTNIISKDLRASYLASTHQCFELYIDVLMQMHKQNPQAGFDAAAFEVSEHGRARSLLELLTEAHAYIRQGVDPGLLQKEKDLLQLLNRKAERHTLLLGQQHSSSGQTEGGDSKISGEIEQLAGEIKDETTKLDEVAAQIRAKSPRYAALTQPRPRSFLDMQRLLDPGSLLLEYSLGDARSYLWAVTRTSITSYELPGRAEIEQAATNLYELMISPGGRDPNETPQQREEALKQAEIQFNKAAAHLSRMLLEPLTRELAGKRIIVVSDGALQYLPFAVLPDPCKDSLNRGGQQPLIVGHEIVSLPSLSALSMLRKDIAGRRQSAGTVAVLADPVYEKDDARVKQIMRERGGRPGKKSTNTDGTIFPDPLLQKGGGESELLNGDTVFHRLPFASREARVIMSFVPKHKRKLALGFTASRATAMSAELSGYRIVHFATHGLLDNIHPGLSGIVLSLVDKNGNVQDGFLRLNEIYNMKLRADMVVLSACQTGLGKEIKGEGLVGLTRGFMYAGAARVMATLWKVDDRASAELMKNFYKAMFGRKHLRASAALRASQITMLNQEQWRKPYYWAAFILQGEWR